MKKISVLVAEDNLELTEEIIKYFEHDEVIEIVATAKTGVEAFAKLKTCQPDFLYLDIIMPELDGFGVLRLLGKERPKIVVCSAVSADSFVAKAIAAGADYYLVKPFAMDNLKARIIDLAMDTADKEVRVRRAQNKALDEKLSNIFLTMGIPAHIKGYQFLREAIKMSIETPDIINSITKKLYPAIAAKFDTSSSKVERAIRHAIEVAWNRGKIENLNALFGIKVYTANEKPTNGEFIALVADKMLIEGV